MLCAATAGPAHAALVLDGSHDSIPLNLTPHWEVLEDERQQWTIDDVIGEPLAQRFARRTGKRESLNFGLTGSAIWLRLTVHNSSENDIERLLEIPFPHLHHVDWYAPGEDGYDEIQTGGAHRFGERPVSHRHFVFPLELKAGGTATYYLRVASGTGLDIPAKLWERKTFNERSMQEYMGQALYFGMLFALGIYNFLLFASLRDRVYLYYVMFLASNLLSTVAFSGIAF